MAELPEQVRGWADGPAFAVLTTLFPDGAPQSSVLWLEREGDDLLFSTLTRRTKYANLRRDPRASAVVLPPTGFYEYAEVRGVVTLTETGGRALIDRLAQKYQGRGPFVGDGPGDVRVVIRLRPERVVVYR